MENGILILKTCLIAWFIVEFYIISAIVEILTDRIKNKLIKFIITKPFECMKCAGFWTGLIMTQNIFIAIIASFLMNEWDKKYNYMKL